MEQMIIEKPKHESDICLNDILPQLENGRCCVNPSVYEITYDYISRKWLVCNQCLDLDFFKTNIKEKVRIKV